MALDHDQITEEAAGDSRSSRPQKAKTSARVLDAIAIVMFIVCLGYASFWGIAHFAPEAFVLAMNPKIDRVCSKMQAFRGLRQHIQATEVPSEIRQQSRMLRTDPAGYHLWSTPQGEYWVPELTDTALWMLLGQQQLDIYSSPESHVSGGDIVLDCGAHVGVFTRIALKRGAKLVVAIEPAPENLECLQRNFRDEIARGRVIVVPKGVWNKNDFLPMHINRNSAGDSFVIDYDPGQKVIQLPLTTIDQIASELHLQRVDFIKMDIKGAEVPALEGAQQTLRSYRPRLAIASEHLPDDPERIPRTVRRARSSYQMACGSCYAEAGATRPEVLHFY